MEDTDDMPEGLEEASSLEEVVEGIQRSFLEEKAKAEFEAFASGKAPPKTVKGQVTYPRYAPQAMVQLIIDNPDWTFKQYAAYFGQKESWFTGVIVSPRFQMALEPRREEVTNPILSGTLDDMFRALTVQSVVVLQKRLEDPKTPSEVAIEAAKLGIKALGMGTGHAPIGQKEPPKTLNDLANNLLGNALPAASSEAVPADYTIDATLKEVVEPVKDSPV